MEIDKRSTCRDVGDVARLVQDILASFADLEGAICRPLQQVEGFKRDVFERWYTQVDEVGVLMVDSFGIKGRYNVRFGRMDSGCIGESKAAYAGCR